MSDDRRDVSFECAGLNPAWANQDCSDADGAVESCGESAEAQLAFKYDGAKAIDEQAGSSIGLGFILDVAPLSAVLYHRGDFRITFPVLDQAEGFPLVDERHGATARIAKTYIVEPDLVRSFYRAWHKTVDLSSDELLAVHALQQKRDAVLSKRMRAAYAEFREQIVEGLFVLRTEGAVGTSAVPDYENVFCQRHSDLPIAREVSK